MTVRHLPGSHTNENIATCVVQVLKEYNIDASKINGIVTDNASNCRRIGNLIAAQFNRTNTDIIHIGCNAHVLNLIVKSTNEDFSNIEVLHEDDDEDSTDTSSLLNASDQNMLKNI